MLGTLRLQLCNCQLIVYQAKILTDSCNIISLMALPT
jgi:hypothetical protein